MSWSCSIVNSHADANKPGHMWKSDNGHWLILLPNDTVHDINGLSDNGMPWNVMGIAPNLTAHPSIHAKGWHGWLQYGILSD